MDTKELIKKKALELGFHDLGFTSAEPLDEDAARLSRWINEGRHASMGYLERWAEVRRDPGHPGMLEGAGTVISLVIAYESPLLSAQTGLLPHLAGYSRGPDYHHVLRRMLKALLAELRSSLPGLRGRCLVDSAPIFERALAMRAGVGGIGRNSCLIHPRFGSFCVLGELVISEVLEPDPPFARDLCGSCRACVRLCPGGALSAPDGRELDARRCLSYWTIEAASDQIPEALASASAFFGCDLCQRCCPWNQGLAILETPLAPLERWFAIRLRDIAEMELDELKALISGTGLERAGPLALRARARLLSGTR